MLTASGIFIVLGTLCLIASKVWSIQIQQYERYKGRADGVVSQILVDLPDEDGRANGIHDYYYPVIAFYANGRLYKLKYHKGSNPCRYHVQEKLDIRYNKNDPTQFEIKEDQTTAILSNLIYYLGLVLCCVGGIFFLLFATRY